jgi:hypothetical protein
MTAREGRALWVVEERSGKRWHAFDASPFKREAYRMRDYHIDKHIAREGGSLRDARRVLRIRRYVPEAGDGE